MTKPYELQIFFKGIANAKFILCYATLEEAEETEQYIIELQSKPLPKRWMFIKADNITAHFDSAEVSCMTIAKKEPTYYDQLFTSIPLG